MLSLPRDNVVYLVGSPNIFIDPLPPYSEKVCDFLEELSQSLRLDERAKKFPDIAALSFWCRRGHINKLRESLTTSQIRLGLGVVFHITPANVPINFAYSYIFGLLAGNANIVRLPSKSFEQTSIFCEVLETILQKDIYHEIRSMTAFVRFDAKDDVTSAFSKLCNARIIWGGDLTISQIRTIPIPPRGVEIAFADRFSACVINNESLSSLSDLDLIRLAEKFYNDTYIMDQNACSSPHLVIWVGREEAQAKRFWLSLESVVKAKYALEYAQAVDKYTLLCQAAIDHPSVKTFNSHGGLLYRIALDKLPSSLEELRGRFGLFYEYSASSLEQLAPAVGTKFQTLTYFGFDKEHLAAFIAQNRLRGIDRIVPIGRALDISVIWDGYDIVRSLSRVIDIQ